MHRLLALTFALLLALAGLPAATQSFAAQPPPLNQTGPATDDPADVQAAADAARELSRLEAARDFDALYDLMHPDAQRLIPRPAVVGWYETLFASTATAELTVTAVELVAWTWGVTSEVYPGTAAVAFVQPYTEAGITTDVPGVVHLVPHDGGWGWFLGEDTAFVNAQIAAHAPGADPVPNPVLPDPPSAPARADTGDYASPFADDPFLQHIDHYWARAFAAAGRPYDPPDAVVPIATAIDTACGPGDPQLDAAFYCVLDETVYYTLDFYNLINGVGDFSWITVIAHEWSHHVQAELNIFATANPQFDGGRYTIELELQADCLAGAYTQDAEARGWLDPGDLDEALILTNAAGDPEDIPWYDPGAHGTPDQRLGAFLAGYRSGATACNLPL